MSDYEIKHNALLEKLDMDNDDVEAVVESYINTRNKLKEAEQEIVELKEKLGRHVDKIVDQQTLLKDIFKDITKDNRLPPDTFDRLVEVVKNGI